MSTAYDLSVVAPVYNEADSIEIFLDELYKNLDLIGITFEVILVDDHSNDSTWEIVLESLKKYKNLSALRLRSNVGHMGALEEGLRNARGKWYLTLDSDLQHPPRFIQKLWDERQLSNVINTKQLKRQDSYLKGKLSKIFYDLSAKISGVEVEKDVGDFRLIHSDEAKYLLSLNEPKMIRFQIYKHKIDHKTITYQADPRIAGKTKYNFRKMLRLAGNSLVMLSPRPLFYSYFFFSLFFMLNIVLSIFVLMQLYNGQGFSEYLLIILFVSFSMSVLFLVLGILGTYISYLITRLNSHNKGNVERSVFYDDN